MVAAAGTLSPYPPPAAASEEEDERMGPRSGSGSTTPQGQQQMKAAAPAPAPAPAPAAAAPPPLPLGGRRRLGLRGCPVPLVKARGLLLAAVQEMPTTSPYGGGHAADPPSDPSSSSSSPESTPRAGRKPHFLRMEVPVSDVEDEEDALVWLRAQPPSTQPRVFFRVPERTLVAAGLGAAHLVQGSEELGAGYAAALGFDDDGENVPEDVTYYGGGRFDPRYPRPSADWEGFGTAYLVLPALELVQDRRRQQRRRRQRQEQQQQQQRREKNGHQSPETQLQQPWPSSPPPPPEMDDDDEDDEGGNEGFVLAVNLRFGSWEELAAARASLLALLQEACVDTAGGDGDDEGEDALLPAPVSCEEPSQFEAWHEGIGRALAAMRQGDYRKVVLARAAQFTFPRRPRPLDLVLQLRAHCGYLFCLQLDVDRAFLGCTPEQLFKVRADGVLSTEALAGTRPRGATPEDDERLAAELMASAKDRFENRVTAESIEEALRPLALGGRVERDPAFVLRLRHVQHICHKISARLAPDAATATAASSSPLGPAFRLLAALHPTPAVAGEPRRTALQAIRALEPFDRGFYAGPVGYVSPTCAEFAVAIRSVLLVGDRAHVFAGAGIVPGSTAEGEWAEIGAKMANFVRMFPAPAAPLRSLPNLSTLWATLVVEELVRNGVTHFCVAPGSRSTPLVTAAARHPHTTLMVHHDERGAGFYCLGYARAKGRPAAVIVTSGTAVANLLPAAVEAATDRVPLLLLTADRPPEARDTGANQTVTQPGMFATCARWAKDFPCPTHEVLAASLLSDMDYAVSVARGVDPGPVHLNFMLRENLAPEGGVVRDAAVPGLSSEWSDACLGDRRFAQWERSLQPYTAFPRLRPACPLAPDLLAALRDAQRGLLVLGRLPQRRDRAHARWLAQTLRWPVFADIGSGLRGDRALRPYLVGPYEALLADPVTSAALDPDCVLQVGAPLVSKRLPKFLVASRAPTLVHVLPSPARRDPELAATHHVCADIPTFVRALDAALSAYPSPSPSSTPARAPSGLLPLLRALAARVEGDVAGELGPEPAERSLTEPMVAYLVTRCLPRGHGLFLSNSMPVRDVDAFASASHAAAGKDGDGGLHQVAMNRGASGIDGILSTAMGYAAGLGEPVTLLVGDMACLHDLNALHALTAPAPPGSPPPPPLTVVLVNNGGGGIFSFLPIARHADVFSPFFDSPHDLDFGPVAKAFGLPYRLCRSAGDLVTALGQAQGSGRPAVLEVVTERAQNVRVHRSLGAGMRASLHAGLAGLLRLDWARAGPRASGSHQSKPSLLLLHGFLGCKEDWAPFLWPGAGRRGGGGSGSGGLAQDYDCLAVDLPGHGCTTVDPAAAGTSAAYSLPVVALALVRLLDRLGVERVAVVGYSMGGRLAAYLAQQYPERVSVLVVASAHPGLRTEGERLERREQDRRLGERLLRAQAQGGGEHWDAFLRWWYGKPLWGRLAERAPAYPRMLRRRRASLERSEDPGGVARALLGMSVAQQPGLWDFLRSGQVPTLVAYGAADVKYAALAEELRGGLMAEHGGSAAVTRTRVEVKCIDDAGHAVLTEKEPETLREVSAFLRRHLEDPQQAPPPAECLAPSAAALGVAPASRMAGLRCIPFALPLRQPIMLSAGGAMAERRGLLVVLRADSGVAGVGEVSPLPGFSLESLAAAERQVQEVAKALAGKPLPRALPEWVDWLGKAASLGVPALLPSVRAGLEMALVHLLAQQHRVGVPAVLAAGRAHLLHTGRVRLNGLVLRQQHRQQPQRGGTKVKVGGRPVEEDVARVNALLEALGPGERVRLDANQAWTLEEALRFVQALGRPERVEYVEEPCRDPLCLPELYHRTGQRVRFALDESLAAPPRPLAEMVGMPGLAALVLKPTVLGGLSTSLDLHALAACKGLAAVVSSSFESSVGLCHLTLLASLLNHDGRRSTGVAEDGSGGSGTLHGLATYAAFVEEPHLQQQRTGYEDLVWPGAHSLLVDVAGCQELLDAQVRGGHEAAAAAAVVSEGGNGSKSPPPPPERAGMENGNGHQQAVAASSSSSSSSDPRKRQGSP